MKFVGIIPARYASSRFPGKPLVDIQGMSMIQRVYEQCQKANLDTVVVATDDQRIFDHVSNFGGTAIMTSEAHQSGTDRVAEASNTLNLKDDDIVINIQGDEPFIDPEDIALLKSCFKTRDTEIATLIRKIDDVDILNNPNNPKVVLGEQSQALYFSRQAIPYLRGVEMKDWLDKGDFYQHIGIYAFRKKTLDAITQLQVSKLERSEGLEQLRWLENGYQIKTAITKNDSIAVDKPEDLLRIRDQFFS